MKKWSVLYIVLILSVLLTGCAVFGSQRNDEDCLRFGVLRVEDSLPLIIAEQEGLFPEPTEIILFSNTRDMDLALEAGVIDGVLSDIVRTILFKNTDEEVRIVATASLESNTKRRFALVSSPASQIFTYEDINDSDIAISGNSVISLLAEKMLSEKDVSESSYTFRSLPDIRLRMEAVINDAVSMAVLPEPLVSMVESEGGRVLLTDLNLDKAYSQTVIIFRNDYIMEKPEKVIDFLSVFSETGQLLNANQDQYATIIEEKAGIPLDLLENYQINAPEGIYLPSEDLLDEIVQWMLIKEMIMSEYTYSELVSDIYQEQNYDS